MHESLRLSLYLPYVVIAHSCPTPPRRPMKPKSAQRLRWSALVVLLLFAGLFFWTQEPGGFDAALYIGGSIVFYIVLSNLLDAITDRTWQRKG